MNRIMIYGANGFSGKIVVASAIKAGLAPIVAGRSKQKLKKMAAELSLDYRIFPLDDMGLAVDAMAGVSIVLNCAGPFSHTFYPMVEACIEAGVDYLDITGEINIFEAAAARSKEFEQAGIMVMPGVAFDVVPSDCLAVHLKSRLPDANALRLYFNIFDHDMNRISHGTNSTFMESLGLRNKVRHNGVIETRAIGFDTHKIDFNGRKLSVTGLPWGDVSTAYHSTGIRNISTFMDLPFLSAFTMKMSNFLPSLWQSSFVQKMLAKIAMLLPGDPDSDLRNRSRSYILGEATNDSNERVQTILDMPEVYNFTGLSAAAVMKAVFDGKRKSGHQTAGKLFGADFVLSIEDVRRTDI